MQLTTNSAIISIVNRIIRSNKMSMHPQGRIQKQKQEFDLISTEAP